MNVLVNSRQFYKLIGISGERDGQNIWIWGVINIYITTEDLEVHELLCRGSYIGGMC